MTDKDKLAKVRAEIEKLNAKLLRGACSSQIAMETMCKEEAYNEVLAILDTMQKEPVSENLEVELNKYIKDHFTIDKEQLDKFGIEEKDYMYSMDKGDMLALVEHFTNWQKTKEEPVSEDLMDATNDYGLNVRKGYPRVMDETDRYIYNAFQAGAKWQKEQIMKDAIDAKIESFTNGTIYDADFNFDSNLKDNDKVKVIVIKEN